jgi:type I restriction enzyme S subunit
MREDWISDKLSNCIKLKSGDGLTAKDMTLGDYPVFGGNRIAGYHNEFNQTGEHVIIGRVGALCGNVRYINENIWLTDNAFRISEFKYDFDLKFLYYFLNHVNLRSYARQTAQPVISNSSLKNVNLTFPKSLQEQQQIVTILDQAFEAIDQAKVNIEKNIKNAKELFQSKLNDIFSQKGEGWEEKSLKGMSKIMYGYTSKVVENGNVQYVRITDIQDGNVNWNTVPFVNISEEEKPKYKLAKGDIVFARTGATTGKSYLIQNPPNSVFASYLIRVQCDSNILIPSFLYLFFQSGIYWQIVELGTSGSAQGGFNASKLGAMVIHFPTDKKQQLEYVDLIESIRVPVSEMIVNYEKRLQNLEELKKSILQKAFAGELTNKAIEV